MEEKIKIKNSFFQKQKMDNEISQVIALDTLFQSRECCNHDSPRNILSCLFTQSEQSEIWNKIEVLVLRSCIEEKIKLLHVPLDQLFDYLRINEKNDEKFEKWIYLGAILNDPKCQCQLSSGYRVKKQYEQWKYWATKSAKQNCIRGMISLLDWYIDQTPKDTKTIQLLLDDILQENPVNATEQNNLAASYLHIKQYDKAEPWLMKAISQGSIIAHYNMATCEYKRGNLERALYWVLLAAEKDKDDQDFVKLIIKIYTKLNKLELANEWKAKLK